jgi:hypothetical protein
MEDTMVSRELASDNHEGSLVFHKSCTRVLRDLNPASISMFMFVSCGLGFGVSSYGDVGFGFSLGSILIKCVAI